MKVLWKIKRLDGTTDDVVTEEDSAPIPGDGKILNGIPVKIGSHVTTPTSEPHTGYGIVAAAEEQEI